MGRTYARLPGDRSTGRPTIAPHVRSPAHAPAAPRAAWLARAADQRPHVPRHLAARRPPAPARRVHGDAPAALPRPALPPAFDAVGASSSRSTSRARIPTARRDGRRDRRGDWFADQLRPYGFVVRPDPFEADSRRDAGGCSFENLIAVGPGRSPSAIVVMAHRDNSGAGAGANDNASGTAALIELARSYANPAAPSTAPSTSQRVTPAHTLVFLSTDGGALGGIGAAHFAEHSPLARDVVAVDRPRRDRRRAARRGSSSQATGRRCRAARSSRPPRPGSSSRGATPPRRPSALRQLLDLALPVQLLRAGAAARARGSRR